MSEQSDSEIFRDGYTLNVIKNLGFSQESHFESFRPHFGNF